MSKRQTAAITVGARPTIAWDGQALWLAGEQTPELQRLDPTTLETVETIPLSRPARLLAGDENGLWLYAEPEADADAVDG